ncbi:response regulator transcription factor [Metasolibacillus sp. FSL H7-0170]|uniref:response regulator transcription factor n=1 Tax=Metasolibacillus TaxID=2703677 RepID=UPI000D380DEB|nr:response regulator transcription factor [Metasolibacillus fluoroglycofenilyticus]
MQQAKIIVVDDEKEIADLISLHLEKEFYDVITCYDSTKVLSILQNQIIDLIILDIMMPNMDGYTLATQIRKNFNMPIIFVSAKTSDFDKVHGLALGADDYITKPFTPIELAARVNAQLRRFKTLNTAFSTTAPILQYGGLIILPEKREVKLYDEVLDLTRKEFDILYLLASHPKKIFSTENIFEEVWNEAYFEGANTVMVHIRNLRKKLKENKKNQFIKTVWGVGYTFND